MQTRIYKSLTKGDRKFSRRLYLTSAIFVAGIAWFGFASRLDTISGLVIAQEMQTAPQSGSSDYSRFRHSNPMHARLPCLLCHKRETNSPIPKRSVGHLPCAGCHVQQFADKSHPICVICHTNSETGAMKRFPPLRSFGVRFDHASHLRRTNCATCHKPTRGGVALTIPTRSNAHTTCFQCHSANRSNRMSSCGVCHVSGRISPVSGSARAFGVNFSHAKHARNQCSVCHTARSGAARGRQMSAPLVSMHFAAKGVASCGNCHNNKRAFGGEDFSDCKRCHLGNSFSF